MSLPKTTGAWTIKASSQQSGWENLKLVEDYPVSELGDNDVLVRIAAVSLNYRDLVIPKGMYPLPLNLPIVAASDGAGEVVAVGSKVNSFSKGDKIVTQFAYAHQDGPVKIEYMPTALGGAVDGTLRKFAVFPDHAIVHAPANLSFREAGTLTCAPLTSWNALFGLRSRALKPGDVVLTEGTGGVSLSAIQFAKATGATVIATTSSDEKGERLKKLGADHVINYKTDKNWGETAKNLTPNKEGVDHILEVGGPGTMQQALKAIKPEGVISVIGFLGGFTAEDAPTPLAALSAACIIRGIVIGSKAQLIEMNRAIEANKIQPIVDEKEFSFENAAEAYEYQWQQKNFGKVVITVS